MIEVIASLAPVFLRGHVTTWAASLAPEQRERIDLHSPIALEAARRNDALAPMQFQRALDAMGIGLFARDLWGPTVNYMARGGR